MPRKEATDFSVWRCLKASYLSVFVLFFRMSGWDGSMKARTAVMCLTVVDFILVLTIWAWLQTTFQFHIEVARWIIGGAALATYFVNDYLLVDRNVGVIFEKEFRHFHTRKQIALLLVAGGAVAAIGVAFYLSVAIYHQSLNIR